MKKNVRGKGKGGREGYALIYAIVILIIAMASVSGGFLTSSGQQRTVERGLDRMEAEAICQMIFERTHKIINDFITVNGDFPRHAEDNTHHDNRHVYMSADVANNTRVANDLASWFSSLKAVGSDVKDILKDYELVKLDSAWADPVRVVLRYSPSDPATPEPNDEYRIYEVTVKVRNIYTKAEAVLSLNIKASTGTLYNYGVFSNEDLEINPGFDWKLQGPIFTNGNVYMTSGLGKTLTIETPDAGRAENFALKSAKSIYFFYKTAVGKNYLNSPSEHNDVYQRATAGTMMANNMGKEEELCFIDFWRPFQYVFFNNAVYQDPPRYDANGIGSYIKILDGATTIDLVKPIVSANWTDFVNFGSAINPLPSQSGTSMPAVPILTTRWYYGNPYNETSNAANWNYPINISLNDGDSSGPRKILTWDYENGIQTCDPPATNTNPGSSTKWIGVKNGSKVLVADSKSPAKVNTRAIPVGKAGLETHTLIEPLVDNGDEDGDGIIVGDQDDVSIRKSKFQTYANVVVQCLRNGASGLACTARAGATPSELAAGSTNFLNIVPFYDERLEPLSDPAGTVAKRFAVVVDIPVLEQYMQVTVGTRRVILYVQTPVYAKIPTLDTQTLYPPVVILSNGAKVPSEEDIPANKDKRGFSVVTNGRLWVRGDFNTWTASGMCTGASIKDGTCKAPPVELFCDSFGVLSNNWDSSFATSGVKKALSDKVVTQDTIVNAAIFTGMLPSLLEKAKHVAPAVEDGVHPAVWDSRWGKPFDARDCETMTATDPESVWKCSARIGGYAPPNPAAGEGYKIDFFGGGWVCPKGLNPDGSPVDPAGCDYYRDENYIYYVNKAGPAFTKYKTNVELLYNVTTCANPPCETTYLPSNTCAPDKCPKAVNLTFHALNTQSTTDPKRYWYYYTRYGTKDSAGNITYGAPVQYPGNADYRTDRKVSRPAFYPITDTSRPIPLLTFEDHIYDMVNTSPDFIDWPGRPKPSATYPGLGATPLIESILSRTTKYTCVQNARQDPAGYRQVVICGGDGGCATQSVYTPGGKFLDGCVCGSQYDVPNPTGANYGFPYAYGRGWTADGKHPTLDGADNPIDATDATDIATNYVGKGVCPKVEDNFYLEVPTLHYWHYSVYSPLFVPRYSGGLENVINLQESWDPPATPNHSKQKKLYVSGVLGIVWRSTQLRLADGTLGYFREPYYTAPVRDFDFNERLSAHPPPLTKDAGFMLFSVKRQQYTDVTKEAGS